MEIKIIFCCLLLICANIVYSLYPSSSAVVDLTPDNFDKLVLNSNELWIVEFYAPWCGHCKQFVNDYSKTAEALKGIFKVGAIDADKYGVFASKYGIKGFPTIKFFINGKASQFEGPRSTRGLIDSVFSELRNVVNSRIGDGSRHSGKNNVIEVDDSNFKEKVLNSKEPFLLEFYAPWCGHCKNLEPIWRSVADELKSEEYPVKIGAIDATVNKVTASEYGIKGFPTIKLFMDGNVEDYEGSRSKSDIIEYIKNKVADSVPPPEVTQLVSQKLLEEGCASKQLCIISFLPHILDCDSKCRNDYLEVLKKTTEDHKKYGYLWAEAIQQPDLENSFGVGGFGYPAMVALNFRKMKYSLLRGSFSKDGIHEFLRDLSYGKGSSVPVPGAKLPKIIVTDPWDGKDGELPVHASDEL